MTAESEWKERGWAGWLEGEGVSGLAVERWDEGGGADLMGVRRREPRLRMLSMLRCELVEVVGEGERGRERLRNFQG